VTLRKLQQELRVSKKAESLAKDKLAQTKKQLEKTEKDFAKHKEEAEQRIEALRSEISVWQRQAEHLQSSAEVESPGEKQNDFQRIIDEYAKQAEHRQKEVEGFQGKLDRKKTKVAELIGKEKEAEAKILRLKSTLDNVKTFMRLLNTNFLKSVKSYNATLRSTVDDHNDQFKRFMEECQREVQSKIAWKVTQMERQFEERLKEEKSRT